MRRFFFVLLVAIGLLITSATPIAAGGPFTLRVPVLMYHPIQCEVTGDSASLFLCPDDLDAQLALLEDRGWHTVTATQLAEALTSRTCLPAKTFVITLDDGALDGYQNGAPIMEKHGFRGTFAIVVGKVGDYHTNPDLSKPHFDWDQARDLVDRGHDIANHTMFHTSVASMSTSGLDEAVAKAQRRIKNRLGFAPKTFVYPYGSVGKGTAPAYLSSRFQMAFTTQPGGVHSTEKPMLSPRVRVSRSTTPEGLLDRMSNYQNPCG